MLNSNLKRQAKPREFVLSILGMLSLFYLTYNVVYSPKSFELADLRQQLKGIEDQALSLEKLNQVLREKNAQSEQQSIVTADMFGKQDPRLALIQRFKKQKFQSVADFLSEISTPSFRGLMEISSVRHDLPTINPGYEQSRFYMTATGDFPTVISFLKRVESMAVLLSLDAVNFKIGSGEDERVDVEINGTFYKLEDE